MDRGREGSTEAMAACGTSRHRSSILLASTNTKTRDEDTMSEVTRGTLVALGLEFRTTKKDYDKLDKQLKRLKTAIRETAKTLEDDLQPTLDGPTYYIDLDSEGSQLKVTRSDDDPAPPLDPQKFLAVVGPEAFFRFVKLETVPANAFDAEEWTRALMEEEYTTQQLQDSLGEAPNPKAWSVGVK